MSGPPGFFAAYFGTGAKPSEEVRKEYGEWQKPDEMSAREKFVQHHQHHDVFALSCRAKELKEFGEGHLLYFCFLKYTAYMFGVLALFPGAFLIVVNVIGGWYPKADIERTMLGNFGLVSFNGKSSDLVVDSSSSTVVTERSASVEGTVSLMFMSTAHSASAHLSGGWDKRSAIVSMSALDLVGVLVFFVYCMFMIWFIRWTAEQADKDTTTLKDYAVRVQGLPPDTNSNALRQYLLGLAGEGSEIVELELCRKVHRLLGLVVERGEEMRRFELATAELQRHAEVFPKVPNKLEATVLNSRYSLAAINREIQEEQSRRQLTEVVSAFVTFNTADARFRCLCALPGSKMRQWRLPPERRFHNGAPQGESSAGRRGSSLTLTPAPEPSDVLHENLEYGALKRFGIRIYTDAAKYCVLLLGFAFINLAPAIRVGMVGTGSGTSRTTCDSSCAYTDAAGNYYLSTANRALYKQCDSTAGSGTYPNKLDCEELTVCYECYCRAVLNAGSYGESAYCARFASVIAMSTFSQVLAVISIVAINMTIQWTIGYLTLLERHHTRSAQARSHARGLWMTQFINTAFASLVANMYLPGPAAVITGSFLEGLLFTGVYADTTPNWFRDVARPVVFSIFLGTIITHVKIWLFYWYRNYCLRTRYRCLTQAQLDEAFMGHEFNLAVKYGQHMYVIFVVMTYSSGIPLFYLLAVLHFASCYWAEKFELLRICKRPPAYSRNLAQYVATTLPFAALWHLAFALWFYSLYGVSRSPLTTSTFRNGLAAVLRHFQSIMAVASNLTPELIAQRMTQNNAAHLLIFFMVCSGVLLIFFTLSAWIKAMRGLASLLGLSHDSPAAGVTLGNVPEFQVAVRSQLLLGPASYAVQQNPVYAHAFVQVDEFAVEDKDKDVTRYNASEEGQLPPVGGDGVAAVIAVRPASGPRDASSIEPQIVSQPGVADSGDPADPEPQGFLARAFDRKARARQKMRSMHNAASGSHTNKVAPESELSAVAAAGLGGGVRSDAMIEAAMPITPPAGGASQMMLQQPQQAQPYPYHDDTPDARTGAWD